MKLALADAAIALSFAFNLGARYLTIFLSTTLTAYVASANSIESNPARGLILAQNWMALAFLAITFAMLFGFYFYLRKRKDVNQAWEFAYINYTMVIFMLFMMDFLNDAVIVAGILYR